MSIGDGWLTVCEVNSVEGSNDIGQLRLGLGQIINHLDQLRDYEPGASGLLWTSREPRDAGRWQRIPQADLFTGQAVFILAWMRDGGDIERLGAGFGLARTTSSVCHAE